MILYVFCIVTYSNYRYLMINEDFWLLHEIYEIAIMIIIAWHVSIGALWRLSQACCLGFPLSSKGLTASGLQLVSAFNTRDVSHLSTEKSEIWKLWTRKKLPIYPNTSQYLMSWGAQFIASCNPLVSSEEESQKVSSFQMMHGQIDGS